MRLTRRQVKAAEHSTDRAAKRRREVARKRAIKAHQATAKAKKATKES